MICCLCNRESISLPVLIFLHGFLTLYPSVFRNILSYFSYMFNLSLYIGSFASAFQYMVWFNQFKSCLTNLLTTTLSICCPALSFWKSHLYFSLCHGTPHPFFFFFTLFRSSHILLWLQFQAESHVLKVYIWIPDLSSDLKTWISLLY